MIVRLKGYGATTNVAGSTARSADERIEQIRKDCSPAEADRRERQYRAWLQRCSDARARGPAAVAALVAEVTRSSASPSDRRRKSGGVVMLKTQPVKLWPELR